MDGAAGFGRSDRGSELLRDFNSQAASSAASATQKSQPRAAPYRPYSTEFPRGAAMSKNSCVLELAFTVGLVSIPCRARSGSRHAVVGGS